MRTEAELIQLLIDSGDVYNTYGYGGLCGLCTQLQIDNVINMKEFEILDNIIDDNQPSNPYNIYFYFKPMQWQPRKEYLQQLLIKYSK